MAHAKFSPSGATTWIPCPGSIGMSEGIEDKSSPYAEEGTLAHDTGEKLLLDLPVPETIEQDMIDNVQVYVDYVNSLKCSPVWVERQVSLAEYIPDCFGTADFIGIHNKTLHVVDLKYGKGVKVDAENNLQLQIYALGALSELELSYDIKTVKIAIVQPRLDHISECDLSLELLKVFVEKLKQAHADAMSPDPPFNPGEKQCRWCRAKAICRARAQYNIKTALEDFAEPMPNAKKLTLAEIADLLPRLDDLQAWAKSLKDYAQEQALAGKDVPGFKLVAGRSISKWVTGAEKTLLKHPKADQLIIKKPVTLTEAKKVLGKKDPIFDKLVFKPEGKPALVPAIDKRKPYQLKSSAAEDFANHYLS